MRMSGHCSMPRTWLLTWIDMVARYYWLFFWLKGRRDAHALTDGQWAAFHSNCTGMGSINYAGSRDDNAASAKGREKEKKGREACCIFLLFWYFCFRVMQKYKEKQSTEYGKQKSSIDSSLPLLRFVCSCVVSVKVRQDPFRPIPRKKK